MILLTGLLFSYSQIMKVVIKAEKIHIDALLTVIHKITPTLKLDLMFVNANNVNAENLLNVTKLFICPWLLYFGKRWAWM